MEFLTEFVHAILELSYAMAPYILFGLLFAGILHEFISDDFVTKHLGKDSIGSVLKATIFGIPLPVCSCGVIPLATGIKKSGASNGATLSFLISTPITGIDSILATYGMFGWAFTIYRIITSMIISIIAGILANVTAKPQASFTQTPPAFSQTAPAFTQHTPAQEASFCSRSSCCDTELKKGFQLKGALNYAFITLLGDIAAPLVIGLLLGALITVAVPENLAQILQENSWLSYGIVLAIAIPMYVCATASLPIAAGLMLSGVSPGAAFVFLSAGPATNTVTIGVVKKMLGSQVLYIYLSTIIIGSMLFGFGLDYLLSDVSVKEMIHMHEEAGWLEYGSTVLLGVLVAYVLLKPYLQKDSGSCCSS